MNTFTKLLSMFLVVVMCLGLFATSAYATSFDFGGDSAASDTPRDGSYAFQGGSESAYTPTDGFAPNSFEQPVYDVPDMPAADGSFTVNADSPKAAVPTEAANTTTTNNKTEDGSFEFSSSNSDTFNMPYEDKDPDVQKEIEIVETEAVFNKNDPHDITILKSEYDTFSRFKYVLGTNFDYADYLPESALKRQADSLKINQKWLLQREVGYYTLWGIRQDNGMPVSLGHFQVNAGDYDDDSEWGATIYNSPYYKPRTWDTKLDWDIPIVASGSGISKMKGGFGVAATNGSYTRVLSAASDYIYSGTNSIELDNKYLNNLPDGEYWLIGFPVENRTSEQKKLGKFIVKSGDIDDNALGFLSPDNQVWYSGTDPLSFYCDIFNAAGKEWNFKGYGEDVIVPDIRVSTRSSMSGAVSVRIDQYWDLNYGYFMLGQNFLSTLSPEETYYMQVVDARHPATLYSNVVTFRVGPTLRAIDTDKHVINSTRSLRFRSSSPVSEVYVGNIQLTDYNDYGVSYDGKTVTLSYEFLNKRSPGNTYTIKVRNTNGEWASTTFQVLTTAQGSASPRTGDESNLGLWAAFLLLSGTAVVVLIPKLRKHDF